MHLIESIGPILGIVAFVGLATLAFLLFQQARDIRRLREWAGRAPERAQEAAEAVQAVGEASRSEAEAGEEAGPEEGLPGRLGAAWTRVRGGVTSRLARLDRRLPVDGRYVLAVVVIAVIAAGVLTSGFGAFGGANDGKHRGHGGSSGKPNVAVLNGTGVSGLADQVDKQVVEAAGYKTRKVANADSSFANTVVMFAPGHEAQAKKLAKAIEPKLGNTPTQAMTTDVEARSGGAPLVLGLGLDDSQFASAGG
jgi:LytR cell envelope-related transcriptional attenuator